MTSPNKYSLAETTKQSQPSIQQVPATKNSNKCYYNFQKGESILHRNYFNILKKTKQCFEVSLQIVNQTAEKIKDFVLIHSSNRNIKRSKYAHLHRSMLMEEFTKSETCSWWPVIIQQTNCFTIRFSVQDEKLKQHFNYIVEDLEIDMRESIRYRLIIERIGNEYQLIVETTKDVDVLQVNKKEQGELGKSNDKSKTASNVSEQLDKQEMLILEQASSDKNQSTHKVQQPSLPPTAKIQTQIAGRRLFSQQNQAYFQKMMDEKNKESYNLQKKIDEIQGKKGQKKGSYNVYNILAKFEIERCIQLRTQKTKYNHPHKPHTQTQTHKQISIQQIIQKIRQRKIQQANKEQEPAYLQTKKVSPQQNDLGDCYFMSPNLQIITKAQEIIDKIWIFQCPETQSYCVILNDDGVLVPVFTDYKILVEEQNLLFYYCGLSDFNHLPQEQTLRMAVKIILVQKSFAELFGGYKNLQWGLSNEAYMLLASSCTKFYNPEQYQICMELMNKWMRELDMLRNRSKKQENRLSSALKNQISAFYPVVNTDQQIHLITISITDAKEKIKKILFKQDWETTKRSWWKSQGISQEQQIQLIKNFQTHMNDIANSFNNHTYSFNGIQIIGKSYKDLNKVLVKLRDPRGKVVCKFWKSYWPKKQPQPIASVTFEEDQIIMTYQQLINIDATFEVCKYKVSANSYTFHPAFVVGDAPKALRLYLEKPSDICVVLYQKNKRHGWDAAHTQKKQQDIQKNLEQMKKWEYYHVTFVLSRRGQDQLQYFCQKSDQKKKTYFSYFEVEGLSAGFHDLHVAVRQNWQQSNHYYVSLTSNSELSCILPHNLIKPALTTGFIFQLESYPISISLFKQGALGLPSPISIQTVATEEGQGMKSQILNGENGELGLESVIGSGGIQQYTGSLNENYSVKAHLCEFKQGGSQIIKIKYELTFDEESFKEINGNIDLSQLKDAQIDFSQLIQVQFNQVKVQEKDDEYVQKFTIINPNRKINHSTEKQLKNSIAIKLHQDSPKNLLIKLSLNKRYYYEKFVPNKNNIKLMPFVTYSAKIQANKLEDQFYISIDQI